MHCKLADWPCLSLKSRFPTAVVLRAHTCSVKDSAARLTQTCTVRYHNAVHGVENVGQCVSMKCSVVLVSWLALAADKATCIQQCTMPLASSLHMFGDTVASIKPLSHVLAFNKCCCFNFSRSSDFSGRPWVLLTGGSAVIHCPTG